MLSYSVLLLLFSVIASVICYQLLLVSLIVLIVWIALVRVIVLISSICRIVRIVLIRIIVYLLLRMCFAANAILFTHCRLPP